MLQLTCGKELFMLQLTCEKDVGMGLCMFNFVIMLSLHLVSFVLVQNTYIFQYNRYGRQLQRSLIQHLHLFNDKV